MVIYIESVFAFNVLVDYLLLFGAARVAGRTVARRRLLLGAAVGGIYAAVQLFLPKSVVLLLLGLALMGAAAYRGSGRAVKLTLLFFLASCGLAGVVMLLGQSLGSMARLARGVVTANLPWGVFLIAAGTSYLLLSVVFRYGAARTGSETADVVIAYRGKTARVRLLRDTGNTLCDPVTGLGLPATHRSNSCTTSACRSSTVTHWETSSAKKRPRRCRILRIAAWAMQMERCRCCAVKQ
jgi:stage II sporulation protein GA (sporulation sigma-E factor processing peptidase)